MVLIIAIIIFSLYLYSNLNFDCIKSIDGDTINITINDIKRPLSNSIKDAIEPKNGSAKENSNIPTNTESVCIEAMKPSKSSS